MVPQAGSSRFLTFAILISLIHHSSGQDPSLFCALVSRGSCIQFSLCCQQQCGGTTVCVSTTQGTEVDCQCPGNPNPIIASPNPGNGDQNPSPTPSPTGNGDGAAGFPGRRPHSRRPSPVTAKPGFSTSQPLTQNRSCGRRIIAAGQSISTRSGSGNNQINDTSSRNKSRVGTTRIVGGTEAAPHSWPWQASLRLDGQHICGGSVIDSRHILSAAHCTMMSRDRQRYKVVLGLHMLNEMSASQVFDVDQIFVNPQFDSEANSHDSSVFRLSRPITFSSTISPVCIAQADAAAGTNCFVTGWGLTEGTGDRNYLQEVSIPILSKETCRAYWITLFDESTMICAGSRGKSSCQGDSGGPLVCPLPDGRYEVQGIVSYGSLFGCTVAPSVYGRVVGMRDWILNIIGGSQ